MDQYRTSISWLRNFYRVHILMGGCVQELKGAEPPPLNPHPFPSTHNPHSITQPSTPLSPNPFNPQLPIPTSSIFTPTPSTLNPHHGARIKKSIFYIFFTFLMVGVHVNRRVLNLHRPPPFNSQPSTVTTHCVHPYLVDPLGHPEGHTVANPLIIRLCCSVWHCMM